MIKVDLKQVNGTVRAELVTYNAITRIPFSLKIGTHSILPETIYARNFSGETLIELRFDKNTRELYEIALVTIQPDSITFVENIDDFEKKQYLYKCSVQENCNLEISSAIKIYRSNECIKLIWCKDNLNYFRISRDCVIGIDANSNLCSITLMSLSLDKIIEILAL